jgi:hypothetical protein
VYYFLSLPNQVWETRSHKGLVQVLEWRSAETLEHTWAWGVKGNPRPPLAFLPPPPLKWLTPPRQEYKYNNHDTEYSSCHGAPTNNKHYCLTDLSVDSNDITALVSGEQKHYFHLWGLQNHSWPSPLVIFSVPTRENNVFYSPFTAQ